jgi:hypothetical protein
MCPPAVLPVLLAGLSLHQYNEPLLDLMSRLLVAPMATRYLFWKKVQSIMTLRQK